MELYLKLPDSLETSEFDTRMYIAAKLFEGGRLSSEQAAQLAGVSKRTFIELCGQYGVAVFQQSVEEIKADMANARALFR